MHRFFILLCCLGPACNSQNDQPATATNTRQSTGSDSTTTASAPAANQLSTDSAIAIIRTAFQQINKLPLKSQSFKWTAENCNNEGTATYYFNNNEIVKVVETGAIGDGSWTTAYYYQQGRFIFSLDTDTGGPAAGPDITTTHRKYVYANKVIRTMENDTYISSTDSTLTPASQEYQILAAYKTKNFEAAFCQ